MSPVMSMKTRVDGIVSHTLQHLEIGEFQLPLLVLSTDSTSRMLMETDANNSEVYIKISKSYQLKSSDSVLTELGYDDIAKLDTPWDVRGRWKRWKCGRRGRKPRVWTRSCRQRNDWSRRTRRRRRRRPPRRRRRGRTPL